MSKNLRDQIFASGILESGNPEELAQFKKTYRQVYKKEYNKAFAAKHKRKTLVFKPEELTYLEEQAKAYHMKLAPFLKAVIFGYLSSTFISPNKESLSNIEFLLRQMQDKISNLAPSLFRQGVDLSLIQELKDQIRELDSFMRNALNNPPRLEKWIEDQMKNDPDFIPKLLTAIAHLMPRS